MDFAGFAEERSGGFRCEVALRGGEQFIAHHELANGGGAQQRWEIVRVQVPDFVRLAVRRPLMESH